jgi:hypothetical protein
MISSLKTSGLCAAVSSHRFRDRETDPPPVVAIDLFGSESVRQRQ